jgi:hypothetical protein
MRARATWFVVGALMALGVVAVIDALPWPGASEAPVAHEEQAPPPAADRPPERFAAVGVLYYTDNFCRLRGLSLPSLQTVEVPEWEGSGFSLAPRAEGVLPQGVTWEPRGTKRVAGIGGYVYVASDAAGWEYRFRGAAPAFRPDGALTFVRDSEVLELTGYCRPPRRAPSCERVLLTSRDLLRPLADGSGTPVAEDIAWLTPTRLAVVLRFEQEDMIALYEGHELVDLVPGIDARFTELTVSPGRHYLAARVARPSGFVFVDRDGRPFVLVGVRRDNYGRAPFTAGRAVAWSPDDSWAAVARTHTIAFFSMGSERPHFVNVELTAFDLAWAPRSGVREPAPDHRSSGET